MGDIKGATKKDIARKGLFHLRLTGYFIDAIYLLLLQVKHPLHGTLLNRKMA